jgi:hypothetical protein
MAILMAAALLMVLCPDKAVEASLEVVDVPAVAKVIAVVAAAARGIPVGAAEEAMSEVVAVVGVAEAEATAEAVVAAVLE